MSGGAGETWSIYLATILAATIILVALVASLVIYQRRFVALHRSYSKQLLNAQEEERAWVAREVHDDALQRVALVVHELHDFSEELAGTGRPQQRVSALRGELEDLGVMLRRVAHRLHPSLIEQAGLIPALQGLAVDVSRSLGLTVDLVLPEADAPLRLPRETALILYRIAQEALRNVSKHSGTARARLSVTQRGDAIEMEVTDAGRGFEVSTSASRHPGLGLVSMAERARLADGKFVLWSAPAQGTSVRVTVPLKAIA